MLQNPTREVHLRTRAYPTLPPAGAVGLAITVGVAYFLATQLSVALLAEPDGVAVFWPAAGVSSGVLITLGRGARLPVASGVIFATIIANLMMEDWNFWKAAAFALWNAGEPLLVAWLIERYFGSSFILDRLRNVLGLLAAAVVATAASGIGGMVTSKLLHSPPTPIWIIWEHWFASGTIGIITVAPLVIGLGSALREPPPRNEILEGVVALVLLAAMTVITVLMPPDPWQMVRPIALLFPVLLWLAARCQPAFAAAAVFIISLAIIWAITFGSSPFRILALPIGDRMTGVQVAILIIALCEYLLAALFAERRKHTSALEESEARLQEALTALQEALAAGEVVAFECDLRTGLARHSGNAAQILGLGQTLTVAEFVERIHPDDRARIEAHHGRMRVDSPADTVAFRFIRPDRSEVWLEKTSRAEFDATGCRPIRLRGLTRDITRYKQAEKRQDLLSAELDHRVKNVLARVASVVRHTRRSSGTPDEFVRAIEDRIQSVAAAHALLSESRWFGVSLTDLIRHQLAPYTTGGNTAISDPDVMLTSAQTQAVAMVIHELATNAAKHGALSGMDGKVSVSWDCTGADGAAILTITWRELGGSPITAPVQSGYGLSLIRDLVPHELGGAVDLTFPPDGACCKIEIPFGRT
jgi:two-component sensor histidine kinase/integral membrane sensor domain MASE1